MKILMVCTENLPVPPVLGGAIQTYISGSLPYLSKNHDITIIGVNDPTLPDEETIDGVNYVRVPGKVLELYRDGVVQYIENNQFDLIHVFNRPRLVLPIRKVAPESKLTLSMHNDMFNLGKIDPEEANLVINEVSNIVTVSDYVGNVIRELYPEASSKIRTIYSGVDSERFLPSNESKMNGVRNTLRKEFGLEDKTVIFFAGRLSENKGVDRLIRALPELSNRFNNLALVVVGSSWFSEEKVTDYVAYIRAISKKQPVPVITTGFVSPYEMQNWFAVADIFVCTSLWQEPLARVHYEAMAAGLPIVTTARGGNPEVIIPGENGLIVEDPEDPSEFAAKITEILSNKSLMKSMGKKGRELAVSNFKWNRVADEILEVWDQSEFSTSITAEQLEEHQSKLVFRTVAPKEIEKKSIPVEDKKMKVKNTKKTKQKTKQKELLQTETNINLVQDEVQQTKIKVKKEKTKVQVEKVLEKIAEESVSKEQEIFVPVSTPTTLKRIRKVTDQVSNKKVITNEANSSETTNEVNNSESQAEIKRQKSDQKVLGRFTSVIDFYDKKHIS